MKNRVSVHERLGRVTKVEYVNRRGDRVDPTTGKPYSNRKDSNKKRELPVKLFGVMFGDLVPMPTDPNLDPAPWVCYNCWQRDHTREDCPRPQITEICDNCGRRGVEVSTCPRCSEAYEKYLLENCQAENEEADQYEINEVLQEIEFREQQEQLLLKEQRQRELELQWEREKELLEQEIKKHRDQEREMQLEQEREREKRRQRERDWERQRLIEIEKEREQKRQMELERERERMRQQELEKQRQMEIAREQERQRREMERRKQLDFERARERERQEIERKKQFEMQMAQEREMREMERIRQLQIERERERERLRQYEMERERQRQIEIERERQRQHELERERQRQQDLERERQRNLELQRQKQIAMERDRQRNLLLERENVAYPPNHGKPIPSLMQPMLMGPAQLNNQQARSINVRPPYGNRDNQTPFVRNQNGIEQNSPMQANDRRTSEPLTGSSAKNNENVDVDPVQDLMLLAKSISHLSAETQELVLRQIMAERQERARQAGIQEPDEENVWP